LFLLCFLASFPEKTKLVEAFIASTEDLSHLPVGSKVEPKPPAIHVHILFLTPAAQAVNTGGPPRHRE
jgi:hypothetical protein